MLVAYPIDVYRSLQAVGLGHRMWGLERPSFLSIYSGLKVACCGVVVYHSMFYAVAETAKCVVEDAPPLAIESFAAVVAGFVCYPLDTVRQRLMCQIGDPNPRYTGAFFAIPSHFVFLCCLFGCVSLLGTSWNSALREAEVLKRKELLVLTPICQLGW
jgi:hypothetical protein